MRVPQPPEVSTCVLCSGGLDSVVLLAWASQRVKAQPVYVRAGLAWEGPEISVLRKVLEAPPLSERTHPLAVLGFDVGDLYPPEHWALRGTPPDYDTPDQDVFLPGRNVMLLSKASVFAASRGIGMIALGPLAGNPFPDATPEFFAAMSRALSLGLAHEITILAPFTSLHKSGVIRLGAALDVPVESTLSCMNPGPAEPGWRPAGQPQTQAPGRGLTSSNGPGESNEERGETLHCGLCSKCRERRDAFAEAGIEDRTRYRSPSPRRAAGGGSR